MRNSLFLPLWQQPRLSSHIWSQILHLVFLRLLHPLGRGVDGDHCLREENFHKQPIHERRFFLHCRSNMFQVNIQNFSSVKLDYLMTEKSNTPFQEIEGIFFTLPSVFADKKVAYSEMKQEMRSFFRPINYSSPNLSSLTEFAIRQNFKRQNFPEVDFRVLLRRPRWSTSTNVYTNSWCD